MHRRCHHVQVEAVATVDGYVLQTVSPTGRNFLGPRLVKGGSPPAMQPVDPFNRREAEELAKAWNRYLAGKPESSPRSRL